MNLKDATAEKHKYAENTIYNQMMLKGELTKEQYSYYLISQYHIFKTVETHFKLPSSSLNRLANISEDLKELGVTNALPDEATTAYCDYLKSLTQEKADAHIYLNYLALMYGGKMLKPNVPSMGKMFDFENPMDAAGSIRAIQKDEWADEVNVGFDYIINIFNYLYMVAIVNPSWYE